MKWLKRFLYYLGRVIRVTKKVDQIFLSRIFPLYEDEMKLKKEKDANGFDSQGGLM